VADPNLALDYLNRLKRKFGIRAVVSEYPALPITFNCPNYGLIIPGYTGYSIELYPLIRSHATDGSLNAEIDKTTYIYNIVIQKYDTTVLDYVDKVIIEVRETRGALDYMVLNPKSVDPEFSGCSIYFLGQNLGPINQPYSISLAPGAVFPSMRTSVRHVDMLSGLLRLLGYTDYQDTYIWAKELIAASTYGTYSGIMDIYAPMGKDLGSPGEIVIPVGEDHFWDAKYWNNKLGYQTLLEMFDAYNLIRVPYSCYPYKSTLVGATQAGLNGPRTFLDALAWCGDPLLDAWLGLYYAAVDNWNNARNNWNSIASKWDGNGVQSSNSFCRGPGYSAVRLAAALALGVMLARRGYISWDIPDQMYRVLDQLQWAGIGYYSPDGTTVYRIYKPDHRGGFIVSYAPIGSYGFVPLRPSLVEFLVRGYRSPPEYGGVLPTNSETTITSMIALRLYRSFRS
jgi:hypothetical protein